MRVISFRITALFILFQTISILPQESFEGKVGYKITSGDESTQMDYFIKDNFIKMDVASMQEESTSMIFDTEKSVMTVIMAEQKMYMEMPIDLKNKMKETTEELKGEFKQTGEKKDILGYSCEQWIYKDDENEIESWMTKDLGSFVFMANPMEQSGSKPEWQTKLEEGGYFPMSVLVKQGEEGKVTTMEVTSVEKKSLDKEIFTPPAGYQKMEIPGMN